MFTTISNCSLATSADIPEANVKTDTGALGLLKKKLRVKLTSRGEGATGVLGREERAEVVDSPLASRTHETTIRQDTCGSK